MSIETHPVQVTRPTRGARCPTKVTLLAYEVYCPFAATSDGELIAFLYARSFPKDQWAEKVREAFAGMELGR